MFTGFIIAVVIVAFVVWAIAAYLKHQTEGLLESFEQLATLLKEDGKDT